jgi:hypothetical protein
LGADLPGSSLNNALMRLGFVIGCVTHEE